MKSQKALTINPIGYIESPYKEKFAIPRQPGLVTAAKGKVILTGKANNAELVKGLAQFSHIWLLFVFHGTQEKGWKNFVRPPRLGGNKKIGVLATRSTFRPNPIGMSVVKLESIELITQQVILHISGLDLLDQTPIIDIKPYVAYSDALSDTKAGFANSQPEAKINVSFTSQAQLALTKFCKQIPELALLIEQVLMQDPRPAYRQGKADNKIYGMRLYHLNIQWQMQTLNNVLVSVITSEPPLVQSE
ncbi:MAG: tRNA (N6-threonylcarbamoyladenosine(37)-N6)-methyltransferase TrmO [Litorilituus sp.]|jgi:tRNA-Thr(GGU) m(6)t(6)A37 methyltransferase TsaA|nr:tRNA (N6-threonylcarbamoyladenosine(37)-N6)-methyltransferase TrmO [Litorilituus sp.]